MSQIKTTNPATYDPTTTVLQGNVSGGKLSPIVIPAATEGQAGLMTAAHAAALTGLFTALNSEASSRAGADTNLQANITAEATARAAADALKAPLASPALTGTPTAPTAPSGASTTQIATTAFVAAADASLLTAIEAEATARAAADTAQTFEAAAGTNPFETTTSLTPRFVGDRALNETSGEWWDGIATAGNVDDWFRAGGADAIEAEATARAAADTAQTFEAAAGTNPFETTTPLTPRFVGDRALNETSGEWWDGIAAAGNADDWFRAGGADAIEAEATARAAADTAQTFEAAAGTNPFEATTPLTPRFVGDRALNETSGEWWDGIAAAGNADDWFRAGGADAIEAEATARAAADTTLQANVDAEAATRAAADLAQTFEASAGTAPESLPTPVTPRRVGDLAINATTGEVFLGVETETGGGAGTPGFGSAQTFEAAAGTNPFEATTPLTPRFVGDRALNETSGEWWDGIDTAGSADDWVRAGGADAIEAEATARAEADTALQANIDAEATARAAADTTLQANIDAEATARAAADATLQTNITAEATARAAADAALTTLTQTSQSGTSYTLTAADIGTEVQCTATSAVTVTVPADIFVAGQGVAITQMSTGQVTLSAGAGFTLLTSSTAKTFGQYATIALICDSATVGRVVGDRATS
jgi:hypothetical protein